MNKDVKFLVAVNNDYIFNKIKEKYGKENVFEYDILSKEDVIEFDESMFSDILGT